ncbi:MAG: hypothetical protein KDC73_10835 [Ignavibacteriae bacterium]|nr:hypothetical protein [Ignavibacteriota bacterium]MCB0725185.1 hypothetical protein [Ignavibacteriota bacterium]MCB9242491.1 hypothetical protein [Ignavibacteriales bacterium]
MIGFWYEQKFTSDATKNAFVMNRIGDFGFMIAMFLIFANFGTLTIFQFIGICRLNLPTLIVSAEKAIEVNF